MTTAAIDGDWIVFKIAFAAQAEAKKKGKEMLPLPLTKKMVDNYLKKLLIDTQCDEYVCLLTARNNFRKNIEYPVKGVMGKHYKKNREGTEFPPYLSEIRQHIIDNHAGLFCDGCEADDGIAIWAIANPDTTVMIHTDKDINTVPGIHYNPTKGELYSLTDEEAFNNLMLQIITGDSTDNIPGLYASASIRVTKELRAKVKEMAEDYMAYLQSTCTQEEIYEGWSGHAQDAADEVLKSYINLTFKTREDKDKLINLALDHTNYTRDLVGICLTEEDLHNMVDSYANEEE